MIRPVALPAPRRADPIGRRAYTLIEILTATALTLVMMTAVVTILGTVSASVSSSRAGLEMMDRLRATQRTMRRDLENVTVTMLPPRRPESAEGYFEYIEGPVGPVPTATPAAENSETGDTDTTVGDFDDILMFTVRSPDVPFVGRYGTGALESQEAEVIWFVRGRTLYRRVLLIAPHALDNLDTDNDGNVDSDDFGSGYGFFNLYDISARPAAYAGSETSWIPNSLVNLTRRECRFAHAVHFNDGFPWNAGRWRQLRMPTLQECSHVDWMTWADNTSYPSVTAVSTMDFWTNPHPWVEVNPVTGTFNDGTTDLEGPRVGEDVILTNVIGFDVKAWDPEAPVLRGVDDNGTPGDLTDDALVVPNIVVLPGDPGYDLALDHPLGLSPISYGAYVDLNYNNGAAGLSSFAGPGNSLSGLAAAPYVYDTWSFHYEHDGQDQFSDGDVDLGTNGFDDDADGVVDNPGELETSPPYPVPLRGIQVKIRVFEPDSRQVREVTIVQDFLPK